MKRILFFLLAWVVLAFVIAGWIFSGSGLYKEFKLIRNGHYASGTIISSDCSKGYTEYVYSFMYSDKEYRGNFHTNAQCGYVWQGDVSIWFLESDPDTNMFIKNNPGDFYTMVSWILPFSFIAAAGVLFSWKSCKWIASRLFKKTA